ncbi:lipoate protein ligase C-terminal domain-containing protein [Candidatus Nanohalobium constans]|uniref:lipoate--protein ligase n=1 Tax=Candidatus Nanohalobium constans TaxID=2565781 RepID=A0A5Q0UGX2_9ARCH|nr:lipoate protein ligase C-terminal domain-containing protein [Candidatus Nanohalobium constans]QGA80902.1 hypothetical protein LC1Nh_1029 [Candidatus Nanohalobium constans]
MKKASHKVEDGKMVKIQLEINDETVEGVQIRGDFFLEPPEKLEELEKQLEGLKQDSTIEEVAEKAKNVEADLIGFTHEDIGKAFRKALEGDEK